MLECKNFKLFLLTNVRIDLSGVDGRMPQETLDILNIHILF